MALFAGELAGFSSFRLGYGVLMVASPKELGGAKSYGRQERNHLGWVFFIMIPIEDLSVVADPSVVDSGCVQFGE